MVSFEQYHHQHPQPHFDAETSSLESYHTTAMDSYFASAWNNPPYNYDLPVPSVDASMDFTKFDMVRSTSNNSALHHGSHEYSPALLSGSTPSSTISSPYSNPVQMVAMNDNYQYPTMYQPGIVLDEDVYQQSYTEPSYTESDHKLINPNLLGQDFSYTQPQFSNASIYSNWPSSNSSAPSPSPVPSHNYNQSRFRETSVSSHRSGASPQTSISGDEDGAEKGRCNWPDCGRIFKDLKAHMITHQTERPEKCPIVNCEYHVKGFARKYDKNRHTLTHYRGTMVCGFCPHSGTPDEKSFNRADVFKRHLHTVHKVEQNPPNSRKRSPATPSKKLATFCPDATGKCSTCGGTFSDPQELYNHLDDCVLRRVVQEDDSEGHNQRNLAEIASDPAVEEIYDRNGIKSEDVPQFVEYGEEEEEDDDDEEDEDEDETDQFGVTTSRTTKASTSRAVLGGHIAKRKSTTKGMTWSKHGVKLLGKGRKRRKHYPPSWGMTADKMKMKKRVLCVYNGSHRVMKDDMMLKSDFEVRVPLLGTNNWVTDLDVETLNRANAFHNASEGQTEEGRAAWFQPQEHLDF